jgi:hypothetical protein
MGGAARRCCGTGAECLKDTAQIAEWAETSQRGVNNVDVEERTGRAETKAYGADSMVCRDGLTLTTGGR